MNVQKRLFSIIHTYIQKVELYKFKLRYTIYCCYGSCLYLITVNHSRIPVNECNDDVLDIDILMKLSTGTQERVQGLQVELIWEHLSKQDTVISYKAF